MKKNEKCFTLVELLIVIGVFAAMATLLLPALRSERGKAMTTSCAGNLRQMAAAAQMYMDGNNAFFPNGKQAGNTYIDALHRAKLVPKAATDNSAVTFASCPVTPVKVGLKVRIAYDKSFVPPQVYGTQYTNNSNRCGNKETGMYVKDSAPSNEARRKNGAPVPGYGAVPMSNRVMFADSLIKSWKGAIQSANMHAASPEPHDYCAAPYFAHEGSINLAAFTGGVITVNVDEHWTEYFYPCFNNAGASLPWSVLPSRYFDPSGELVSKDNDTRE